METLRSSGMEVHRKDLVELSYIQQPSDTLGDLMAYVDRGVHASDGCVYVYVCVWMGIYVCICVMRCFTRTRLS